MNENQPDTQRQKIQVPWRLYGMIFFLTLMIAGAIAYIFHQHYNLYAVHEPLLADISEIELNITTFHLWFEEILSNDRSHDIKMVRRLLDQAKGSLNALIRNTTEDYGRFHLSHASHMGDNIVEPIEAGIEKLNELGNIFEKRYYDMVSSGPGTNIDKHFDQVFTEFMNKTGEIKKEIQNSKSDHFAELRVIQPSLILASLILSVLIAVILYRFERRRAKDILSMLQSEEKYRSLTNNLNVGVFRNTIGPKGASIEVNPAILEIFGYDSRDEYLKVSVSDLYMNPDGRKKYNEKILRDGFVKNEELQLRKKDGTPLVGSVSAVTVKDEKGEVKYFDGILEDITEHKQAVEKLRESEDKYRILFEKANIGISVVQDGFVKSPNPKILDLHGCSEEEIISIPFINFIHPEDRELVQDRHERRLRGEELPTTYSYRILDKAGDAKWVELNVELILWEGKPATLCFLKDITNQKQTEEERKKLEAQLIQAQKMEAIGTLAGGIAHDFNNILSSIMGNAEMALYDISEESPARYSVDQIIKASCRARDLVKQILAFSRKTDREMKPIKINLIIKEALKLLRSSLPATIEIRQKISSDRDIIVADPTQIHQILMNLCTNANYAMREEGGILEVSMSSVDLDSESAAAYPELKLGSYLRLIVSDTGCGMDRQDMERIFDPFFTTKAKGTGLGLAIVKKAVEENDGRITVETKPGEGTVFALLLPEGVPDADADRGTSDMIG